MKKETRIISMDYEHSTDEVIDWLKFFNINYIRFNVVNDIENEKFNFSLKKIYKNKSNQKTWIRKLGFFKNLNSYKNYLSKESFEISNYLYFELNCLRKILYINAGEFICHPISIALTKVELLNSAMQYKIDVPETYVTNNKEELIRLYNLHNGKIIIKSLTDPPFFKKQDFFFSPLTKKISDVDFVKIPDRFFPTLIQRQIEKEYEIRSFFLKGKFYSAAIFSQLDKQTQIDFRNYNYIKPNRRVPYKLPAKVEKRIKLFLEFNNINTGSVDLIKGVDGKFYFLEINPCGQFGMISIPCNFKLEKEIALNLA